MDFQSCLATIAQIVAIIVGVIGISEYLKRKSKTKKISIATEDSIAECYRKLGGPSSYLGRPISTEQQAANSHFGTTGKLQRFQGKEHATKVWDGERNDFIMGVSIYSSKYGAFPVWGSIGERYEELGGTTSPLGFPISFEEEVPPFPPGQPTIRQRFEGGSITSPFGQPQSVHITSRP